MVFLVIILHIIELTKFLGVFRCIKRLTRIKKYAIFK